MYLTNFTASGQDIFWICWIKNFTFNFYDNATLELEIIQDLYEKELLFPRTYNMYIINCSLKSCDLTIFINWNVITLKIYFIVYSKNRQTIPVLEQRIWKVHKYYCFQITWKCNGKFLERFLILPTEHALCILYCETWYQDKRTICTKT